MPVNYQYRKPKIIGNAISNRVERHKHYAPEKKSEYN
jgi:hypothetical protein